MRSKEVTTGEIMDFLIEFKDFAIEHFATKEDLKAFATKEDLKSFATKDDLHDLRDEMQSGFYRLDTKIDGVEERLTKRIDQLEYRNMEDFTALVQVTQKHDRRIKKLETALGV